MVKLDQEWLQHLLHYDPLTGVWTWMNPLKHSSVRRGDIAGRIMSNGRRQIRIHYGFYYSARLAWLYMTGSWPVCEMDHINRIKDDDRWCNLREATRSQNAFNRAWCEQRGDLRCISEDERGWLMVNVGSRFLGRFATLEEAVKVRDEALEKRAGPFAVVERKVS